MKTFIIQLYFLFVQFRLLRSIDVPSKGSCKLGRVTNHECVIWALSLCLRSHPVATRGIAAPKPFSLNAAKLQTSSIMTPSLSCLQNFPGAEENFLKVSDVMAMHNQEVNPGAGELFPPGEQISLDWISSSLLKIYLSNIPWMYQEQFFIKSDTWQTNVHLDWLLINGRKRTPHRSYIRLKIISWWKLKLQFWSFINNFPGTVLPGMWRVSFLSPETKQLTKS